MSTLTITRGLPASGKTTWALDWLAGDPAGRARVSRDDLRAMMFEKPTYDWDQEQVVTEAETNLVRILLTTSRDVIVDATHLRPRYVRTWARFAAAHGALVEVVEFPIDVDDAIARDAARARTVGEEVIRRMASRYTRGGHLLPVDLSQPTAGPPPDRYEPVPGAQAAVIVDIDGTLALHNGRDPYDLGRCGDDLPNAAVIDAVQAAARDGMTVIYCSGRENSARGATSSWLTRHVGVPGALLMRETGDRRKDSIVKRELFDTHIREHFDVRYVLDDRQQVVDMWRQLGLTVFQVAPGDF